MKIKSKRGQKLKRLRKKADDLWYHAVVKEYGPKCLLCGKQVSKAHHFIPKGRCSVLRYYIPNGVNLCFSCHHLFHYTGDPRISLKIIELRGQKWYDDLILRSQKTAKTNTIGYYQDQIDRLECYIASEMHQNASQSTKI